jgi:hypothetical protein
MILSAFALWLLEENWRCGSFGFMVLGGTARVHESKRYILCSEVKHARTLLFLHSIGHQVINALHASWPI